MKRDYYSKAVFRKFRLYAQAHYMLHISDESSLACGFKDLISSHPSWRTMQDLFLESALSQISRARVNYGGKEGGKSGELARGCLSYCS